MGQALKREMSMHFDIRIFPNGLLAVRLRSWCKALIFR